MNRKFVSKSNLVLRKVLNSKEHLDITQDFIETFLKIKIKEISLNPYLKCKEKYLPKEENFGIVDVRIKTTENKELNIGIQIIDGYYIQNKILLYYAQIHANQLEYDKNRKIVDTITINILDGIYFKAKKYHKILELKEDTGTSNLKEKMELHILELPKFEQGDDEKEDAWMRYLVGKNVDFNKEQFQKIKKLDDLLKNFWKNEKME